MGEIADMMLDGTMDCETGEWNFDGEDGPGFPMTGQEAAAFKRATGWRSSSPLAYRSDPVFRVKKSTRKLIEKVGKLVNHDAYHWTVRKPDGQIIAHWWPHKNKFRMAGSETRIGCVEAFIAALSYREESK